MRTTVTLDADTERLIRRAMRERGQSFKTALNEAIRIGLTQGRSAGRRRFRQKSFRLGTGQGFRWDKAALEHEAELCSSDSDFVHFPGLRWRNPLG
jgi:hypothetical protein